MNILLMIYKNRKEDDKIIYYYLYIYRERETVVHSLLSSKEISFREDWIALSILN